MHTIEVDFDVLKQLMMRRESEDVTYNDVIRNLLEMEPSKQISPKGADSSKADDWVAKGVRFPAGTQFRANYKGQVYTGLVEGGSLVVNGDRFGSLSAAAVTISASPVNGWRFWECRLPGKGWQLAESLRR